MITFSALKGVTQFLTALKIALSKKELLQFISQRRYLHYLITATLMIMPYIGLTSLLYSPKDGAFNYVCSVLVKLFALGVSSWYINMRWETFHASRGNNYDEVDVSTGILAGFTVVIVGDITLLMI